MSSTRTDPSATPVMQQFHKVKDEHRDALVFFRMGDFYELFYDDAKEASRALGITLTSRSKGDGAIPMAGVPVKSHESYLKRLVQLGYKVAVCEQLTDPKDTTGIVERGVVRVVTAGTLTEESLLDESRPNYLCAVLRGKQAAGLAWVDLSTGRFLVDRLPFEQLAEELARIAPSELLVTDGDERLQTALDGVVKALEVVVTRRGPWEFDGDAAHEALLRTLNVRTLAGFGLEERDERVRAAGALASYLEETQRTALHHLRRIECFRRDDKLWLDRSTRHCLELLRTLREGKKEGSLLSVLDHTATPMGARLLRDWVLCPLRDPRAILERQDGVATFHEDAALRRTVREALRSIQDLERLAGRISTERAHARDLVGLRSSLARIPAIRDALEGVPCTEVARARERLHPLEDLVAELEAALVDEPPLAVKDGGLLRDGYDAEVDELRALSREGRSWVARFEEQEIERTGIANLKVGFNRVFGYYLEVTRSQVESVPAHYVRKQTLKNAERYITPELKEYEAKVLQADERVKELEYRAFLALRARACAAIEPLLETAAALAHLDVLAGLAELAVARRYVAPRIDDSGELEILDGRHPVIEAHLGEGQFVPNDVHLNLDDQRMVILTGPNMSGKSTYIRQVALITLMAQMGSFVPARKARIGAVDRIFARIGSADDLTAGNSTFMVEMIETANILNNATKRSLVILDEVGRGTSTFDGLSIAWAVCEQLHERIGARTLFATHYHELTDLAERFRGVQNRNVAVHERGQEIVFLHQIQDGGTDRSYGIHVARLAGIPKGILERAEEILESLEDAEVDLARRILGAEHSPKRQRERQLTLFEDPSEAVLRELRALELAHLTPFDALAKLKELQERL